MDLFTYPLLLLMCISELKIKGHPIPWPWQWESGTYLYPSSVSHSSRRRFWSCSTGGAWSPCPDLFCRTDEGSIWCCKKQYRASHDSFILFARTRCFEGTLVLKFPGFLFLMNGSQLGKSFLRSSLSLIKWIWMTISLAVSNVGKVCVRSLDLHAESCYDSIR